MSSYSERIDYERKCAEAKALAGALNYGNIDDCDDDEMCTRLEIDGFTWTGTAWKPDEDGSLRDAMDERSAFENGQPIRVPSVPVSDLPLFAFVDPHQSE